MEDNIFTNLIKLVEPFAKNKAALESVSESSTFLKDLQVSSSRLVDIVLAIEDTFKIEVSDSEADKISTVGSAISLIKAKTCAT